MKNSFSRFAFAALLSTVAGMVFAGSNPSFKNSTESNQKNWHLTDTLADGTQIQCRDAKWDFGDAGVRDAEDCRELSLRGVDGSSTKGFETVDEAVLSVAQRVQNNQCQIQRDLDPNDEYDPGFGVEVNVNGYERDGKYFVGDSHWFSDNRIAAKHSPALGVDLNLKRVFSFHNHPNTKIIPGKGGMRSDTFSPADIKNAIVEKVPKYTMPCYLEGGGTKLRILKFDPATRVVSARAVAMDENGKVRYAGEWYKDEYETNRAKNTPPDGGLKKGQSDNTKPVSMDDLKNMNLGDKNGDWCHCENPQCIKQINRDATGKLLSHCVGFECAKCRKINVEYAKLALSIHQEALDQGLRPLWHGLNAEADAKAAGNAK